MTSLWIVLSRFVFLATRQESTVFFHLPRFSLAKLNAIKKYSFTFQLKLNIKNKNIMWKDNIDIPWKKESEVVQSCPTLCNPMDCSLPGSSVHGIFQARILEWVAISFSRRSSQPRDWTRVSHIVGRCFTIWATRKFLDSNYYHFMIMVSNFTYT